ncbi:MAG TPA: preprotein translocase subunit SecE [Thermoanaerobaculia bacterium]|nr:preprotein translocase subunit SecE [Thermoanaerobaculia bacterium]
MNWWNRLTTFLKEVRAEMAKVSFPSREEVLSTSIVVVVASFIFGLFLWISDFAIIKAYQWLFGALGG